MILSGFCFASSISSFRMFTLIDGCTTSITGTVAASADRRKVLGEVERQVGVIAALTTFATVARNSV